MRRTALIISVLSLIIISTEAFAAKLVEIKVIDKDFVMIYFKDGDVNFVDDGLGGTAFTGDHDTANNYKVTYGTALNTTNAVNTGNWVIKCAADSNYGTAGQNPSNCYRKSKLNGMAEMDWSGSDFIYDYTTEHTIYMRLPYPMGQGKTYTIEINANTNSDVLSRGLTFDIFSSRSEAVHVNLVGYLADSSVKAVDLFIWMGDGLARDYSTFVGKKAYIYNVDTTASQQVGTVQFWMASSNNDVGWYNFSMSDVWRADFTGFNTPGTYRIAIEGVGCSEDFEIKNDAYFEPFRVSTLGYFYMRIGQSTNYPGMPVPRRPLYIPGVSPSNTTVYITSMSPVHPDWGTFSSGSDVWDKRDEWAAYSTGRQNNNAYGGHSDAADWDRHLGHISDTYDMLLPFILTDGNLPEDNIGIAESGNGIPDILDEARNEVDFWLRLRDGDGYSHGINNPNGSNVLYQAGNTPIAAWASAANAAMLSNCFMLSGLTSLSNTYRDAAVTAYNYASALPDQMLTATQNIGDYDIRGRDLKMMAAAFLYNVTGNTAYEDMLNSLCEITSDTSTVIGSGKYQLWACAGYLKTKRTVHYPTLFSRMRNSVINEAKSVESNNTANRPSRRAADNQMGYWKTAHNVQRCMVGHAVATSPSDKSIFEDAMVLEADWGLGRNSLNIIYMTTATTPLAGKRSVENCYTTGRDDGSPGVHPGHTPYLNTQDWYTGMIMGKPSWMTDKCYPAFGDYQSTGWPKAEGYFNTRYVWAHSEFTPRQTMRGKAALYGYLYGLYNTSVPSAPTGLSAAPGDELVTLNWNDNSEGDLGGYNVYRATVSGGPYTKQNTSLLSSSNYTDVNVTNGTTYYYVVTAVDTSANESGNSAEVSAAPYGDTMPPAVPTGLSATPGNGTVSLNWNDNGEGDLAGYNIYRSTVSGGPYTKQNGTLLSSSAYTDNNVTNGTTYYYVVTAVDTSTNESGYSGQVPATPVDLPPAAPTGLSAVAGDATVSLNWNDNGEGDLAGYNIYRSTVSGGPYTKRNGTLLSSSAYIDNSVTNGTTYYYVVTAVDAGTHESGYSSQVSAAPELRTDIEILGSWATGTSHTKENGTNRALVFIAHVEHSSAITLNSVTYGGQPMTKVLDTIVGSGTRAYVAAYILDEAGVAAATSSTFTPSWSTSPGAVGYASVFLGNVDQADLTGASAYNGIESSTTTITTTPLATSSGDMVFVAATCGNSGSYTLNSGFTEGTDQTMGSTATGAAGRKLATGASETPSATHTSVNRQVIIGFVVNARPASGYSTCGEVIAAGYRLVADIDGTGNCYVDYYDLGTFVDYWLNDTCTGPDNCHGADFEPANGVVDLFDFSIFANQWLTCNNPADSECSPNWE